MISDGDGGVFVSFKADSGGLGNNPKIYLQRIDYNGNRFWGNESKYFKSIPPQSRGNICTDESSGFYVVWSDTLEDGSWRAISQHLNENGESLWDESGISISEYSQGASLVSDGIGGIVFLWGDQRNGIDSDIYGQRFDFWGDLLWDSMDVAISIRTENQYPDKVFSENDNILVVWYEIGAGSGQGIFAQLINREGVLGEPITGIKDHSDIPFEFTLAQNYPNPFNSQTIIEYSLNFPTTVTLSVYDVTGREVIQLILGNQEKGHHQVSWNGYDRFGQSVASGIYFYKLQVDRTNKVRKMVFIR
jgi:hypothetical protein